MKAVIFLSLLTLASAAPKKKGPPVDPTVANEFNLDHKDSENCPGLLLLWARGTDQEGNMGASPGPQLAKMLKEEFNLAQIQGINYPACVEDVLLPKGTTEAAIANMTDYVQQVWENKKCPYTPVILGGYSQGAAVVHGAVDQLSEKHFWHVKGVVTFGDTRKTIDGGKFGNLEPVRSLNICNDGDTICTNGTMEITDAHSDYAKHVQKAYDHICKVVHMKPAKGKKQTWRETEH